MYPPDTYPFSFYFLCNYLAAAYPAVLLYDRLAFISIYELVCGDQWLYVLESHLGSTPISARRDESLGARHFAIDHHDASNRSEEHTPELQSRGPRVWRLLLCKTQN